MKFRKFGRIAMATVVSLGLEFGIAACGVSNTVDYVFVTASKNDPGQINVYALDYQSGALTQIRDSPYPSGGRNPVADATTPNNKYLYVLNHDDNTIVQFAIGTDGKIYPQHTYNTPGSFPVALSINGAGTFLYVVDTYQPGFSTSNPGPGALAVFPINTDGSLGTAVANGNLSYFPLGNNPVAVNSLANGNFVYVVDKNDARVRQFQTGSGGALTALGTVPVGVAPNALASDPTNRFLYVTDGAANQMIGFLVQTNGTLVAMQAPFKTDILPNSVVTDPRGFYVYVSNFNSNDITAYTIDQATGNAVQIAGAATYATGTGPTCIIIEPALGRYIYTSNFLDNTVSGLQLNPNSGSLVQVQNTPFLSSSQPTCVAAIAHGNHSIQHTQG